MRKILALIFLAVSVAQASPPPGTYDLYNGEGIKTGEITSTLAGKDHFQVVTKLEYPGVSSTFRFTETDTVEMKDGAVVSFRRDSDENGKKNFFIGTLRGADLVINYEVDGKKFSTSISSSSYDMTEFEMNLPGSKFRALSPGQSKTLKVFSLDRMDVVPMSRNVSQIQKFPYHEETVPVMVVTTLTNGKITTSWIHAKTGELLQEEGTDYLMSRQE